MAWHSLVVISVLLNISIIGADKSFAALSLSNDQAEDIAPNGAPLSAETKRLFQAVREGELSDVQQAVIDGADLLAVNADSMTAADLAESLNHFTITHFLRAYQAIENRTRASTTLVETEEPGPAPLPEVSAPEEAAQYQTPISGKGVIPQEETETIAETTSQPAQVSSQASVKSPVSELSGETSEKTEETPPSMTSGPIEEPLAQPAAEESLGDYFARLSTLNPSHAPKKPETGAPVGQVIDSDNGLESVASLIEPPKDLADTDEAIPLSIETAEIAEETEGERSFDGQAEKIIEPETANLAFVPETPRRKPDEDLSGEASIFASVEEEPELGKLGGPDIVSEQLGIAEEVDVPMLAEVPEIPEPSIAASPSDDESSFFAQMRVFDEGAEFLQPPSEDEPEAVARNVELLPEYEKIRAAVIEKLRRESDERSKQLADVRDKNLEETEKEDKIRKHQSGTQNIQTELRAKQRTALTGTSLPPGYVPPPDGGSSGVRFLQRLGLFDPTEAEQIAEIQSRQGAGLPSGTSSYDQSVLMEAGETVVLPELSPGKLAKKSLAFIDYGYSAPPAGRAIDTQEDHAVAALGQIARLFQSPNVGYPSQTSVLPQPGALPPPDPAQGYLGRTALPQTPSSAPLSSSDLASPPPLSSSGMVAETLSQPVTIPEIPVSPSDLAQLAPPYPAACSGMGCNLDG